MPANIDHVNREQDNVVAATFQSPADTAANTSGQWKAAARKIDGGRPQFAESPLRRSGATTPDSALLRSPANKANSIESDTDSIGFQWESLDTPDGRSGDQQDWHSTTLSDRTVATMSDDVIVTSPMFSKLSPQLSQLETALTNEMLKRPNEWQLSDLELNVEQIYSQTRNPVERLQAQRILDKLKNCKKIRSGYAQSFQAAGETFGTSLSPALRAARSTNPARLGRPGNLADAPTRPNRVGIIGSGVDTDMEANTLYDAHGWLTELVSADRNNRPVYVLVNDEGKITHHIAPSPGLNLHRYLKSKVGVSGRQGYNNVLKLSHVTVDNVSELIRR